MRGTMVYPRPPWPSPSSSMGIVIDWDYHHLHGIPWSTPETMAYAGAVVCPAAAVYVVVVVIYAVGVVHRHYHLYGGPWSTWSAHGLLGVPWSTPPAALA